jgi:HEAT repeat protein
MGKREVYSRELVATRDREAYLLERSGLPGPRGNLELLDAAADVADPEEIRRWAAIGPNDAGTNEPRGFLAMCGVAGLGRLAVEGDGPAVDELRRHANDPRWRVREAVAIALQRIGDADLDGMQATAEAWADGTAYERRAAVAAVAEPRLLRDPVGARRAVALLDRITASFADDPGDRRGDAAVTLRKALGYAWSVVIVGDPQGGKTAFERWLGSDDRDVRWLCRENLKKARLERMDAAWVGECRERLAD